ncbi:AAA domain-containing protein [soil metagenome]
MQQIFQSYLKRLTNLTGKNKSIFLPRLLFNYFIDVHDFDYLNNKTSFCIIETLIAQKSSVELCPVLDSRDNKTNEVSRRLKNIKRTEKIISEESGSRDLYLGWPFIKGKLNDGTLIRCPLLYFPVSLETEENSWILKKRQDINISLNKAFLMAYAHFNEIKISEELLEFTFEDFENESRAFRTSLYNLFKNNPVIFNFNQENFIDKLISFEDLKKNDLDAKEKTGEMKLIPQAVIGLFPQADSFLVPDYEEMIKIDSFDDLEDFFYSRTIPQEEGQRSRSGDFSFLEKVKEEQTFTPYNLDAFQENAIKAVKQGNSLIVQGPPGSGKSELICNLIADFIARGKKVLLVCQKKAALDVVYKRLGDKEITPFTGMVHDFKNDRKNIYHQIDRQINRLTEYKHQNISLDAIQLERNYILASRRIDQITEELNEFRFALFDESECGASVKELYLNSDLNKPCIHMKQEYQFYKLNDSSDFLRKLKSYALYFNKLEIEGHPWKNRKSFTGYGISELNSIKEIIEEIPVFNQKISEQTEKIVDTPIALDSAEEIAKQSSKINELLLLLQTDQVYQSFKYMLDFPDKETDSLWLSNLEQVLMKGYEGAGPEVSIPLEKLGFYQEIIQKSLDAQNNPFKYFFWKYFSKSNEILKKVFDNNQLSNNKEGFKTLIEKIDHRLNLEHNINILKNCNWISGVPSGLDKIEFQTFFYHQKRALISKLIFSSLRNFKEYFNPKILDFDQLQIKVSSLLFICQQVPVKKQEWLVFLNQHQFNHILQDPGFSGKLVQSLKNDFESICEFDQLQESLVSHEKIIIKKVLSKASEPLEKSAEEVFLNSLRISWIEHIETKYPILRTISSPKFNLLEEELRNLVLEKANISKEIVLQNVREKTYKEVEYNRLNNMVTYRELQHQVTKKKRIWPIRKLVSEFSGELFNLIPCWLASPETVSAVFPMQQLFDLVIFDEASQCYAEKGLPAMFRGRQIVITGDDKQLSPHDLYKVRWEEDEELPELEIDSLLDLGKQHLMEVHLSGHYRSKALDLISFSNKHFYDNKLKMLPDFCDVNQGSPPLRYVKVEGQWIDNKNEEEAHQTVKLIRTILKESPEKEIGVVTFNSRQQNHIMELLEQEALNHQLKIPDSLIVKNIENVQGDEKDVIIFSVAYAPDKKGRLIMNFGTLNAEGGENRLNVAITRARETIYIVSSIYPAQLKVEGAKNEGPKLLKKYLQFALEVSEGKSVQEPVERRRLNIDWYLKDKLLTFNDYVNKVSLVEELPFADLSVKKNGHYHGLILTDDDHYFKATSIKELHAYDHFHLINKNWKFRRFFSREYWHDPETVKDLTLRFINQTEADA